MGGMNLEYLEVAHKKHQDWNGKYCPLRILNEKRWNSFLKRIEDAMNNKNEVTEKDDDKMKFTN